MRHEPRWGLKCAVATACSEMWLHSMGTEANGGQLRAACSGRVIVACDAQRSLTPSTTALPIRRAVCSGFFFCTSRRASSSSRWVRASGGRPRSLVFIHSAERSVACLRGSRPMLGKPAPISGSYLTIPDDRMARRIDGPEEDGTAELIAWDGVRWRRS